MTFLGNHLQALKNWYESYPFCSSANYQSALINMSWEGMQLDAHASLSKHVLFA
jgi:hypothetical protein